MSASAEVTKLKEELKTTLDQLVKARENAARAQGERDQLIQTVNVLQQALKDARDAIAALHLAERLGEARGQLNECLVRATQPAQPVWLPRATGDGRG